VGQSYAKLLAGLADQLDALCGQIGRATAWAARGGALGGLFACIALWMWPTSSVLRAVLIGAVAAAFIVGRLMLGRIGATLDAWRELPGALQRTGAEIPETVGTMTGLASTAVAHFRQRSIRGIVRDVRALLAIQRTLRQAAGTASGIRDVVTSPWQLVAGLWGLVVMVGLWWAAWSCGFIAVAWRLLR
jgi:hypothetical protein